MDGGWIYAIFLERPRPISSNVRFSSEAPVWTFSLSDVELKRACHKYPSLASSHDLNKMEHSATAGINVEQDGYFDNNSVLTQFDRLFMVLSFKEDFKDHEIEVVVDNARTHSAREYSVNDFSKDVDTKCLVMLSNMLIIKVSSCLCRAILPWASTAASQRAWSNWLKISTY